MTSTPSATPSIHHHYNPGWHDDDTLIANFVARLDDFAFLREELVHTGFESSAQHYILVGPRGTGKTTLLKRLAVAMRRDENLRDHLIALSFPEELYQVKNLSDFWWAACDALVDELDRMELQKLADQLANAIDQAKGKKAKQDPLSDAGLHLLMQHCANLKRRPVLLVDNLDLAIQRIDKSGRKRIDPHSPAYWALREALSTTRSPIVIGGSVRLSEPFTDYDKAFYDFFVPKRLGKLPLKDARRVLERLAEAQGCPEVKERLHAQPARIEALYELTGGNPRALGLIFELMRQGPGSRAIEDFERLMDLTTPYYKARFEDLSEQAQVVMHALAVRRPGDGHHPGGDDDHLRFGHTAAEIGAHAGLPTGTVSAQMDVLSREGLIEKSSDHGRTQYRISEQLFRLWIQMRGTRRIRQNVIGLTRFLEAMFDLDELKTALQAPPGANALAEAKLAFATAESPVAVSYRRGLEAYGAERLDDHVRERGESTEDYLSAGDLNEDLAKLREMCKQLQQCKGGGLSIAEQEALLGSLELQLENKLAHVQALCEKETAQAERARVQLQLDGERKRLLHGGLLAADLALLFRLRAKGYLPLPVLTPSDVDLAAKERPEQVRSMVWRLLGVRFKLRFPSEEHAKSWLQWGLEHAAGASSDEWANVAGNIRRSKHYTVAQQALDQAFAIGESARAWTERGALEDDFLNHPEEAEAAFRKAISIDPNDALPWHNLGILLENKFQRFDEAEAAYRKAISIDPNDTFPWHNLGCLLADEFQRYDEAEAAYRKAISIDPNFARPWYGLGFLLKNKLQRYDEAEAAYRKAISIDPNRALPWQNLGDLLNQQNRFDEALQAVEKGVDLTTGDLDPYWKNLHINLHTRYHTAAANEALESNTPTNVHEALESLLTQSPDIATALASETFVEHFLAHTLNTPHHATAVLEHMQKLNFDKHARPLLLAMEAAVHHRSDMLAELGPEVQKAAQRMYARLMGGVKQPS